MKYLAIVLPCLLLQQWVHAVCKPGIKIDYFVDEECRVRDPKKIPIEYESTYDFDKCR